MLVLGSVGALVAFGVFLGSARRWYPQWRVARSVVESMPADHLDVIAGAFLQPWAVSWPLVRFAASQSQLVVHGRWPWVPIPPTVVDAGSSEELHARRVVLQFGYRLYLGPSRWVQVPGKAVAQMRALGWAVAAE